VDEVLNGLPSRCPSGNVQTDSEAPLLGKRVNDLVQALVLPALTEPLGPGLHGDDGRRHYTAAADAALPLMG